MDNLSVKCPQCGSNNVRFRERRKNWICDDCDCVFTIGDKSVRRIFISYGHDCSTIVGRIKQDLEQKGYEVWLDTSEIKSGDDWRNTIVNGILGSQAVLAFLSTHSLRQGGVCLDELAIAVGCNRNIIRTCLMDKEAAEMIPSTISGIEYIDLTSWNSLTESQFEQWYSEKFLEICRNIDTAMGFQEDPILKELWRRLHPCISFEDQYIELRKPFAEREWMARMVDDWIANKGSRTLLLTAYPGGGKSAFCAHFFHFHPLAICLTMCKQYMEGVDETLQILKNISFQIATSSIGYRRNLLLVLNNNVGLDLDALDVQSVFSLLICSPFQLEIDGGHAPVIIVVDGVDALDVGEQNLLSELFSNNMGKLPEFVSVMFSARHSGGVINSFSHTSRIDVNPTSKETIEDIKKFLHLAHPSLGEDMVEQIAERCHGSFLYASILSKAISEGSIEIDNNFDVLPQLHGLYFQSMRHIFSEESLFLNYWRPLALLIAWGGEMPAKILQEYMEWKPYEYAKFYSRLMMFLQHRVDVKGVKWVTAVYPSFIEWLTEENDANVFSIPMHAAYKELSDVLWKRYSEGVRLEKIELVKMHELFGKPGFEDKMNVLRHDNLLMRLLLCHVKDYNDDPRDYQTIQQLSRFCQEIACTIDSPEARTISKGTLPFLRIRHDFASSNYGAMINYYEQHKKEMKLFCSQEENLHTLYMISTGLDFLGNRKDAVLGFSQLLEESQKSNLTQYEFYALVGLLWNDHFTNLEEGQKLVSRLVSADFNTIGSEDKTLRKLIVARFKLSAGELKAAFNDFIEVMEVKSDQIWGYSTISARIQMLLIESLVAAYDNNEYRKGIELGRYIYDHIGDSTSVAACYCASWMAMNYLQCGKYDEAGRMLEHAEQKNERLQTVGQSKWMTMHLKGVRSVLQARLGDLESAVDLLLEVVELAKETNDTWVLGDAYFDLCCYAWFSGFALLDKEITLELYSNLQELAKQSELPHLVYKALVMKNVLHPQKDGTDLLLDETQKHLIANSLASTDAITVLYLCRYVCQRFYPDSVELNLLNHAIIDKANEIDNKNPGINYAKRNRIVQLLQEDNTSI